MVSTGGGQYHPLVEMAAVYIEETEIFLSHKAGQFFKHKVRRQAVGFFRRRRTLALPAVATPRSPSTSSREVSSSALGGQPRREVNGG